MTEARDKHMADCASKYNKCIGRSSVTGVVGLVLGAIGALTAPTGIGLVVAFLGGVAVGFDTTDKAPSCRDSRKECEDKAPA